MKLEIILIGVFLLIFLTGISNAGTADTLECLDDKKDCRCEGAKAVAMCEAKIPAAEVSAKIKSLFGYPSNRYIIKNPLDKNNCTKPKRCTAYLAVLKAMESEHQACQYATKEISKVQDEKVRAHMGSIRNVSGNQACTEQAERRTSMGSL